MQMNTYINENANKQTKTKRWQRYMTNEPRTETRYLQMCNKMLWTEACVIGKKSLYATCVEIRRR